MTVVTETGNQTVQQAVSTSNTTYVLAGGSISVNNSNPALTVGSALTNVDIILRDSLIENPLNASGEGIDTDSTLLLQVGAQASIRTGGFAVHAGVAAAGLDVFNEGLITSSNQFAIFGTGAVNSRVVNFGRIVGGIGAVSLSGNGNHAIENAGFLEGSGANGTVVQLGDGNDTFTNSGNVLGRVFLEGGNDTFVNSGTMTSDLAVADNGGTNKFINTGAIIATGGNALGLVNSDDTVVNSGLIFGVLSLGAGNDVVNNTGTIFLIFGSGGSKTILNSGTVTNSVALGTGPDSLTNTGHIIGPVTLGAGDDTYDGSLAQSAPTVSGGAGLDHITGSDFADNFSGDTEEDTLSGGGGDDVLSGGDGGDSIAGGAGNDLISGDDGDDFIDGGAGSDGMDGGDGIDTLTYLTAAGGVVMSLVADPDLNSGAAAGDVAIRIENLNGSAFSDHLMGDGINNQINGDAGNDLVEGGGGDDFLVGSVGNDTLVGGPGVDVLRGNSGNDTYVVEDGSDIIFEETGIDTIQASISFSLGSSAVHGAVENLTLTGAAANGTGNALANLITGDALANVLDGQGGADTMIGLAGNDSYVVDNAGDVVSEAGGAGVDTVFSGVTFSLATALGSVENLALTGAAAINGTGNALANVLVGNAAANTLSGNAGNDTISAGAGNDIVAGGLGNDRLTGGAGLDKFAFNTKPNASASRDIVVDFNHVADTFLLDHTVFTKLGTNGPLTAGFFHLGAAAADADDHIIYSQATGALLYDANGSAAGGAVQFATLINKPALQANDFVVI